MILLSDDGTMDTVLVCDTCGEEFRGNYAGEGPDGCSGSQHECPTGEPDDEDIFCNDPAGPFTYRGKTIAADAKLLATWTANQNYYPSVWFISDHGNAHRLEMYR